MSFVPNSFGHQPTNEYLLLAPPPSSLPINNNFDTLTNMSMNPSIDWKETADLHVFKVDVPGLTKEEVKVEVEDDRMLKISGRRDNETKRIDETWHRAERKGGKFVKTFKLTKDANIDEVKASMKNGVLTVTVPKDANKHFVKIIDISD